MESSEIPNNKLILGIPCETHPEERMVSLVPQNVAALKELGVEVLIENNAGIKAGFNNQQYEDAGASILTSRTEIFNSANVINNAINMESLNTASNFFVNLLGDVSNSNNNFLLPMQSVQTNFNNIVELFAGVGGFRLGLEKYGHKTVWANQGKSWVRW